MKLPLSLIWRALPPPGARESVYCSILILSIPAGKSRVFVCRCLPAHKKAPPPVEAILSRGNYPVLLRITKSITKKELFYASFDIPFDDRPNLMAEVSDLDVGFMRAHLKELGSDLHPYSLTMDAEQIAKDMQLLARMPESLKPRNAAILMFLEQPAWYFRYARIEVVDILDPIGTIAPLKIIGSKKRQQTSVGNPERK